MAKTGCKAALAVCLVLALFLAGSGGEPVPQRPDRVDFGDLAPFPDFDRDPRYSPMMAQYEAILRGEGTFLDGAGEVDLQHINKSVSSDDHVTATAEEFAVVDMDGDGAVEVILRLTVNGNKGEAYVILHYYDGAVYGNTRFIRQLRKLRTDGLFCFSGGAASHGWGTIEFNGGEAIDIRKVEQFGSPDDSFNSTMKYFIEGKEVTEEAYSAVKLGLAKEAKWYGLSFIQRHVHFPTVPGT